MPYALFVVTAPSFDAAYDLGQVVEIGRHQRTKALHLRQVKEFHRKSQLFSCTACDAQFISHEAVLDHDSKRHVPAPLKAVAKAVVPPKIAAPIAAAAVEKEKTNEIV